MGKILKHIVVVSGALFLILGIPVLRSDAFSEWIHGTSVDATSSASVVLEQPSGEYVVAINQEKHTEETLNTWKDFFQGREIDFVFEDIHCAVIKTDVQGMEMARSFQSRLPENQMKLQQEDGVLLLSKAEAGKFDIILMSKEIADAYQAHTLQQTEGVEWITGSKV